jgi:hypothetical protein
MEREFRHYIRNVFSQNLYLAAQERFDKVSVKAPGLIEHGKTPYLNEAWSLAEKYGELAVGELEQLGVHTAEDLTSPQFRPLVESKLKEVQKRMELELFPSGFAP